MEYRSHDREKGGPEIVVMSGFGRNANWLLNIQVTPEAEVTIGSQHFIAAHRVLDEGEAVKVLQGYEQRNRFMAPIVRFVLSRLVGWKYSGSEPDQRRIVSQLPLIAFWPR